MNDGDWIETGDRVFTRRYRFLDQQIGLVLGDGAALVIDTRASHRHAEELRADIARITLSPVTTVVNTHRHWDHTFGNHDFLPAAIWGHHRCRNDLIEHPEVEFQDAIDWKPALADDFRAVTVVPPDCVFEDAVSIEVGGRPVDLRYLGRAHTDGDLVAVVPDAGVLFAGDMLEADAVPWFGEGFPLDWPATAERLLDLVTGAVVPGHGSIGDRAFVESQIADLHAVVGVARRVHSGDLDRAAGLLEMPYEGPKAEVPLDRALAQLRGEFT